MHGDTLGGQILQCPDEAAVVGQRDQFFLGHGSSPAAFGGQVGTLAATIGVSSQDRLPLLRICWFAEAILPLSQQDFTNLRWRYNLSVRLLVVSVNCVG